MKNAIDEIEDMFSDDPATSGAIDQQAEQQAQEASHPDPVERAKRRIFRDMDRLRMASAPGEMPAQRAKRESMARGLARALDILTQELAR